MRLTKQEIWSAFLPYQSASFSQNFLRKIYEANQIEEPVNKSYQNGYSFTYYLVHGQRFFDQSEQAPYEIKPLLLFYGLVQLCKACLLTVDQDYPKNSTVLAHGVSTRKLKKQNFEFLYDTVLIQKKGLFSHMSQTLFGFETLEGQKFQMEQLIHHMPDLNDLFIKLTGRPLCRPVKPSTSMNSYQCTFQLLDDLKLSESRFYQLFKSKMNPVDQSLTSRDSLLFSLLDQTKPEDVFLMDQDGHYYLSCFREGTSKLPELLVHYLILYNLSMISRYETEWWNDLFLQRSSQDISFIQAIIDLTTQKTPQLVSQYLESLTS